MWLPTASHVSLRAYQKFASLGNSAEWDSLRGKGTQNDRLPAFYIPNYSSSEAAQPTMESDHSEAQ